MAEQAEPAPGRSVFTACFVAVCTVFACSGLLVAALVQAVPCRGCPT
jgi:hypothetical protein